MAHISGIGTALSPLGGQTDSVADAAQRKRQTAATDGFRPEDGIGDSTGREPGGRTGLLQKAREAGQAAGSALSQLLRRRTDRGEAADASIEIPPHLERRRAWREAFGLNTYHTQQIAQSGDEAEPTDEARAGAIQAYRSGGRRGRLDLDLAQQVSVTV